MRPLMILFCLAAMLMGSNCPADTQQPTIVVSGQGKATAPPDMATIQTGVVTQAATAQQALQANNQAMEQLLSVLKQNQIADKDVQTSQIDLSPQYKTDERGRDPQIVGYRASNQVRVRVRNLPRLGQVLDALVDAGSNQLNGISFGIDDPTGVLNQARNRAIADARSRAELYAQAAGVRVGKVISISEQSAPGPTPYPARAMMAEAAVPVAAGEQELSATVQMVFELQAD